MNSTSSEGVSQITLQFNLSRGIDSAVQDVQAQINASADWVPTAELPNPPTYREVNPADTPVLILALTSDTLPLHIVDDFVETVLVQKLSQIDGIGQVRGIPVDDSRDDQVETGSPELPSVRTAVSDAPPA